MALFRRPAGRRIPEILVGSLLATLLLTSCDTPAVRLELRLRLGQVLKYRLTSESEVRIDVPGLRSTERTRLEATAQFEVVGITPTGSTVRLNVIPTRYETNGRSTTPPASQQASVDFSSNGSILAVNPIGSSSAQLAADRVTELASLIGVRLPTGRARIGQTWRADIPSPAPGVQRGRVSGLRYVGGHRCSLVSLETTRSLTLTRQLGSALVTLNGRDVTTQNVAFAFDAGFPARISSKDVGRYRVAGAGHPQGTVVVDATTQLELLKG